ncbi:MAG: hypothetical protein ACI4LZ_01365, partial [Anaerovoracaceae bacterium]
MRKYKRKCKKLLSLVLIVAMPFSLSNVPAFAAVSDFSGGTGTAENPYLIATEAQLAIATEADKYYQLVKDITVTGDGYLCATFSGTLDGGGHTISGLKAPLFGELPADATPVIKNLNITYAGGSTSVTGNSAIGVVYANAPSSSKFTTDGQITLSNIHVTITGTAKASGLAGETNQRSVTIENCSVVVGSGAKIADPIAGGLVRHLRPGTEIKNSFVYIETGGSITATSTGDSNVYAGAGGLAGASSNFSGQTEAASITNCYLINKGTIAAAVKYPAAIKVAGAGGIVGMNYNTVVQPNVSNTYVYNEGDITFTGTDGHVGILVGHMGKSNTKDTKSITMSNLIAYTPNSIPMVGTVNPDCEQAATGSKKVDNGADMMKDSTYIGFNLNGAGSSWLKSDSVSPVYGSVAGLEGLPYLIMEFYRGPYNQAEQSLSSDDTDGDGIYTVSYKLDKIRAVSGELTVTLSDNVKLMNEAVEATGTNVTAAMAAGTGVTVGSANLNGNTLTITWGASTDVTPRCVDALDAPKTILSFNVKPTGKKIIDAIGKVVANNPSTPETDTNSILSVEVGVEDPDIAIVDNALSAVNNAS